MKPALVIINPKSGTHSKQAIPALVGSVLGNAACVVYTKAPGHATELAAVAARSGKYSVVVAVGGDGTVNEVASAMTGTGVPMGIVPAGSGNGLARHLRIPINIGKALELVRAGRTADCDTATVCGRPFFCTMGLGFDASVSQAFAEAPRRGLLTYARIALKQFLRYTPQRYTVEVDGRTEEYSAFLIAVCNASQYGNNAYIAPHARLTDGLLDVTIITEGPHYALVGAGLRLFTKGIEHSPLIRSLRGSEIVIRRESGGAGHIDGEAVTLPTEVRAVCRPGSLRLIVP